jgi:hypothetical protein
MRIGVSSMALHHPCFLLSGQRMLAREPAPLLEALGLLTLDGQTLLLTNYTSATLSLIDLSKLPG